MVNKTKFWLFLYFAFIFIDWNISYAAQTVEETAADNISILSKVINWEMLLNIAFALVVILITFFLSKFLPGRIASYLEKRVWMWWINWEEIVSVITRTTSVSILVIWFSTVLAILWVDMSIFMWWVWFWIWFTLRVFLTNFITWIIIVTQWTYHNWDLIEIEGKMWKIKRIYSLYTAVEQINWVVYFVPNIKFLEENVSNYYSNDKRRIDVEAEVTYDTDIYKAKNIMMKVASQFPNILKAPEAKVLVEKLWENWILLTLRVWINSDWEYITTKSNITETVNLAFKKSGIEIPYKKITITNMEDKVKQLKVN